MFSEEMTAWKQLQNSCLTGESAHHWATNVLWLTGNTTDYILH